MNKIIDETSHEEYNAIWAEIDGVTYGIADNLDPSTLMDEDGIPLRTNIAMPESQREEIAETIRELKKN